MKIILLLTSIVLLVGCPTPKPKAFLTIHNSSSYEIINTILILSDGQVIAVNNLLPGITMTLESIHDMRFLSGTIEFNTSQSSLRFRTWDSITIRATQHAEFVILNTTMVRNLANNQIGSLSSFIN